MYSNILHKTLNKLFKYISFFIFGLRLKIDTHFQFVCLMATNEVIQVHWDG